MCWACNPLCGRCKPPQKRAVVCQSCGKTSLFSIDETVDGRAHICPCCGADVSNLVHVEPVVCAKVGGWCAYPCGSRDDPAPVEDFKCKYRTLAKEESAHI